MHRVHVYLSEQSGVKLNTFRWTYWWPKGAWWKKLWIFISHAQHSRFLSIISMRETFLSLRALWSQWAFINNQTLWINFFMQLEFMQRWLIRIVYACWMPATDAFKMQHKKTFKDEFRCMRYLTLILSVRDVSWLSV